MPELTSYESWLIEPESFDYSEFDPRWLKDAEKRPMLLKRYKKVPDIADKLELYLTNSYDKKLAELYFRHLRKTVIEKSTT